MTMRAGILRRLALIQRKECIAPCPYIFARVDRVSEWGSRSIPGALMVRERKIGRRIAVWA